MHPVSTIPTAELVARDVSEGADASARRADPLFVQSVEKALRVLTAFNAKRPTLSLSQLAVATGLDKSAAQRFTHTLQRLGYLRKDPRTKHFELTTRALQPAYHYTQSNPLIRRAMPYLLHLSQTTEEATNLSVLEDNHVVFVARFMSRHMLAANVTVGSHLPAYCTAPGLAMLSRLPQPQLRAILEASTLRAYTAHTTWHMPDILTKIRETEARGYAICVDEMMADDISVAAAIVDADGRPIGAVNIAVSKLRCEPDAAEHRFAPLVTSTAQAISS